MIKEIAIQNFRKHKSSVIKFDERLTVLVGENDTGKSSLISAIQVITNNNNVTKDDFYDVSKPIEILMAVDDDLYGVEAILQDSKVNIRRFTKISARRAHQIKTGISSIPDDELRGIAKFLGVKLAGAPKPATIRDKIVETLSVKESYSKGYFTIDTSRDFPHLSYALSGVEFENLDKFISETFFKTKQKSIWDSEVNGLTLSDFIQGELDKFKVDTESEIRASGIMDIIKSYMSAVDRIEIQPEFDRRDISVNLSVKLLTSSGENRSASGFGDGTKRRLTIALLQHKASSSPERSIYLFDEPDTHLHVRAQNDLLDAFDSIADAGNQVIVTTHSPFIMNAVDVKQVRMFNKYKDIVSIKGNILSEDSKTDTLKDLGIENIHLFFSRNFLIVEGTTEEVFLKIAYKRMFGRELSRDFIKLVNMQGVNNIIEFQKTLNEFVREQDMFVVADKDAKESTKELIERLPIEQIYYIGTKEFEDSFTSQVVYDAWVDQINKNGIDLGPDWTYENVDAVYRDPLKIMDGVIKHLIPLNSGCSYALDKLTLGLALGTYCETHHLPPNLSHLLISINKLAKETHSPEDELATLSAEDLELT